MNLLDMLHCRPRSRIECLGIQFGTGQLELMVLACLRTADLFFGWRCMVRGRPVQLLVLRSLLHFLSFTVLHSTCLPYVDRFEIRVP